MDILKIAVKIIMTKNEVCFFPDLAHSRVRGCVFPRTSRAHPGRVYAVTRTDHRVRAMTRTRVYAIYNTMITRAKRECVFARI